MNKKFKFKKLVEFFTSEPKTQEQLIQLIRKCYQNKVINLETLGMIEGVVLLSQMKVRDIMLPKNQMISINEDATISEAIKIINESGHSRFPVLENSKDDVVGILHSKDLLRFYESEEEDFDLMDLVRQVTFVPEGKPLDTLLTEFRINRNHMAIVVDEYGEVAGFVTLEDILEQIIGDIEDEFDVDEDAYIKIHADKEYIIKAHTPIEEFNAQVNADLNGESYDTIGGLLMKNFGYLPKPKETIEIQGFLFKILNADSRRIKLVECIDKRSEDQEEISGDAANDS